MIKISIKLFILAFLLIQPLLANNFNAAIDSLVDYSIDSLRAVEVENYEFSLKHGKVVFKRGVLYFTGYFSEINHMQRPVFQMRKTAHRRFLQNSWFHSCETDEYGGLQPAV